ncbi:hypothetical protein PV325_012111 [Microctonus aethiopoides]|nr:hypothetical protein PV325_012111 [Microctonus aethiopoides]
MMPSGSTTTTTTSSSHIGSRHGSPTHDYVLENNQSNILTTYLHRIAGYSDLESNTVVKDHCYARPWNWKPENIYVKPTRNIFFSSTRGRINQLQHKLTKNDEDIDVEHEDDSMEQSVIPCNLTKSQQSMEESEKLVNSVRPDDDINNDDWEETVEKTFWSPIQRRLFTSAFNIFHTERLSRLSKTNCAMEVFQRRSSIDTSSKRFRETLASTGWDWRIIQWLHSSLISNLSREYLVIYLDILQTLRSKIPQLIDKMITPVQINNSSVIQTGPIPLESLTAFLKRPWDPVSSHLNANRPKKLPGNPILIVTSSGINVNLSSRQHKWVTQLSAFGMVVTVHSHSGLSSNKMTMTACMDQLVQLTRAKIQDVRNDCPGRPMILVGLNTGAALACQVAQMEHVTAVVCLGFPFSTVEGKRGNPDDMLMDIRCPVMFVIGQNSTLVRPDELEDVRRKMLVETSLVVVGTADDHLRISTAKIVSEGITQSMVDRCILDEIGDFVGGILLQPHPLPLRTTGSIVNFDKMTVKREPRKRKNSTSSSIDSEANSPVPNKKGRPGASNDRWHTPITTPNSISLTKLSTATASTNTPESTVHGNCVSNTTNVTHNIQRRNPRVTQKLINSDQLQLTRQTIQQNTNSPKANGGLTLNIGSLASLAPIGPIRLTPNLSCSSTVNLTPLKHSATNKSSPLPPPPISFTKTSKMIQTSNNLQNLSGKLINTTASINKSLNKTVGSNFHNKNMNIQEKAGEAKLVTVYTSGGNQVRVAATLNTSAMQNKLIGGTTPITAILHSRKGPVNNNAGKTLVSNPTTVLLTSPNELSSSVCCSSTTTGTSTLTTATTTITQVTESSSPSSIINFTGRNQDQDWKNATKKITKITPSNSARSKMFQINENTAGSQTAKFSWVKNSSKDIKKISENPPMITINSNKQEKYWENSSPSLIKIDKSPAELDDDLGNILDIPIIFAKDDDNLNTIDKAPISIPTSLSFASSTDADKQNVGIQVGPSFAPPVSTTVVLLSNRDGQVSARQPITKITNAKINEKGLGQSINVSDISNRHVILQTNPQNSSITTADNITDGTNFNNSHCTMPNLSTIKYTKIILSKRNPGTSNNSGNQVILTKNSCKPSSSNAPGGNQN